MTQTWHPRDTRYYERLDFEALERAVDEGLIRCEEARRHVQPPLVVWLLRAAREVALSKRFGDLVADARRWREHEQDVVYDVLEHFNYYAFIGSWRGRLVNRLGDLIRERVGAGGGGRKKKQAAHENRPVAVPLDEAWDLASQAAAAIEEPQSSLDGEVLLGLETRDAVLLALQDNGWTNREIARFMQTSEPSVSRWIRAAQASYRTAIGR